MREWKSSIYLDAEAVNAFKKAVKDGFYYNWIRLTSISQVMIALLNEHNKNKD